MTRIDGLEQEVRADLNAADAKARGSGSRLVMIGILPTLRQEDVHEGTLSASARYRVMNEQIFAARGEDHPDRHRRSPSSCSPAPTASLPRPRARACQLHAQVTPDAFASYWNAAQAICAVQVALAANSPYLFGRQASGTRPGSPCSSRPLTPGPRS